MGFDRQGLNFREVQHSDLPMLRAWRNDANMAAGWHSPVSIQNDQQQIEWYRSLGATNQAFVALATLAMPDNSGFVGVRQVCPVGLVRFRLDVDSNEARITGIDVSIERQGEGYGKKLLRAAAEHVLWDLGYHRATGEALDTNIAAQKIILACGFKQEGVLRQYVWRSGKWHDWFIYSLLRDELWQEETGVAAG